ncbi:PH domain-containing protein [Blastococcus sp. LR1]|uniref:PH domain-containing protein n=1 Tax=Blastococcus sp. LR1 TaxID=2877000 RepID=UPI001CC9C3A1|nr:PH domain-containing protein [Blastococcus sp. LR1]MCA0146210.1 PH domain-containing protein [Blastococcus sp. LR1]
MPYPDRYLAEDEEVVRRLHPHWSTLVGPVLVLLLVVGGASFGAALVPVGPQQGMVRLGIVVVSLLVLLALVLRPLLRWRTTQYVITTHRLLYREGVLARRGRDIALSRITDVSYEQSLGQRILRSGTLFVETAGDGGPTVLRTVPDSDGVSQLLTHMIDEDADRRAWADPRGGFDEDADRGGWAY